MVMETTNLPQTYIASEGASAERAVNKGVRSVRPSARMVPSLWYYNCTDSVLIRLYPQLEYVQTHVRMQFRPHRMVNGTTLSAHVTNVRYTVPVY